MRKTILILVLSLFAVLGSKAIAQTIQQRLNQGESPKQLFDQGIILDSLYGKDYQGGIIFYLDTILGNGLVSATNNQSTGTEWGCYNSYIGGTSDSIGSGQSNTNAIIASCNSNGIAAGICNNLVLNGYNDWFLPSKNELMLMYHKLKLNSYGNFANASYWSSTEVSSAQAWYITFNNGNANTGNKSNNSYVRAVRIFSGPPILLTKPTICIVGVDSLNNNRIIWEHDSNTLIDSVKIYRETTVAGQYSAIGTSAYTQAGIYLDTNSNPLVQAYRYKISYLDTNHQESFLSPAHKTIHLTINAGLGGVWNLIWTNYEGFNFGSYKIYRGIDSTNMQFLIQIQSNLTSYTDVNPLAGNVYYQIEVVSPHPCYPDSIYSKGKTNYNSSRSNRANTNKAPNIGFNQIENKPLAIKIYPNPNNGNFMLDIKSSTNSKQSYTLEVYSVMGRLLHNERIHFSGRIQKQMRLSSLSKGIYFVRLRSDDGVFVQRFIIE